MKTMQVQEQGGPLVAVEEARPVPGRGEVLLRIKACGVNFADTLMVKGTYQETPPYPFAPGMEVCGIVEEGAGLPVGTRVAAMIGHGGFAEFATAPAAACVPVPDGMSDAHAAAFLVAYGTAHVGLTHRARLQAGETLLVLGAAGGVGLTAIEVGKLLGAKVIACARGAAKCAIAKEAGADHVIDTDSGDIRTEVKALGGADVVWDPVGGAQFKAALRACKPEARLLPLGFASGEVPQIPANILLVKNLDVLGFYWGAYMTFAPEVIVRSLQTLFAWYGEGKLRPHVSHEVPLAEAADALDLLISRKATGKVVVTP
ncbi:NADPH2:quinone reductase [Rubricella aquisinus]|uniref:NADPH2:quinone reductase n=1 Tax=Rubricella aquisinus TaxID=2028108 RepID=A0A840WZN5_9RHOB|nr:NADPH:quinone oxidoreductase family protein [Rubricella aquisinus]MBB5515125.1 NADPH2:quinone reductase [Rubricella aquisinus]